MESDSIPKSRRAVLAAGLGGLAAAVAGGLFGRPTPVRGAHAGTLQLEHDNPTTALTAISTSADFTTAFAGNATSGFGLYGTATTGSGVSADADSGTAVNALSVSGNALSAVSTDGTAVYAYSDTALAVSAESVSSAAIRGNSATGSGVEANSNTKSAVVARTESSSQPAIVARAPNRAGVAGYGGSAPWPAAPAMTGVYGYGSGVGVHARAASGGTAFRAEGPVRFSSAGLATIAAGSRSVTVNPGLDITASSKVLGLPQTSPGGTTAIQRVFRNTTANTFTIWLTANATANTTVAWFVIS
jgi:hypothetical protein